MPRTPTAIAPALALALGVAPLACSSDSTGTDIPPPGGSVVASVDVEPDSLVLALGEPGVLTATVRDSSGAELSLAVTWTTRDATTVTSSAGSAGSVTATGSKVGTTWLVAEAGGEMDSARVTVRETEPTLTGWQVSPSGSSAGAGTAASPWNLDYALDGADGRVQPGDTVWLRGGTYPGAFTSRLAGTAQAPVIVRQWPGERATIDGNLVVFGQDIWIWGIEITNTNPVSMDVQAVDLKAPRAKLINLVIHDASGDGIGAWVEAPDAELSGNVLYNNGRVGSAPGRVAHGIYSQNQTGTKLFRNNVVFQSFGYGLHFYAEQTFLRDFTVDGNVLFENGMVNGCNATIGGAPPVERLTFTHNLTYQRLGDGCVWLGREGPGNGPATVRGNVIAGGDPPLRLYDWAGGLTVDSNTVIRLESHLAEQQGVRSATIFSRNHWYGVPGSPEWLIGGTTYTFADWRQATGQGSTDEYAAISRAVDEVFVRPDPHEAHRAIVVVYSWTGSAGAQVDLSGVLETGQPYTVHHVYRLFGDPVAQGIYQGGVLSIPLAVIPAPVPLVGWPAVESTTAPDFSVFVVRGE